MPNFKLIDQFGNEWNSATLRGHKTVIYVYPKDNTPGCTAEACDIRDNYSRFIESGYKVFGVSKDSKESHQKFASKFDLSFPLLSDPDHSLMEALGAWGEKKNYGKVSMGVVRTTYLIDESGIIVKALGKVKAAENPAQTLEKLA